MHERVYSVQIACCCTPLPPSPGLATVSLADGELASLPAALAAATGLTALRISIVWLRASVFDLSAAPHVLGSMPALQQLELGGCPLSRFPPGTYLQGAV